MRFLSVYAKEFLGNKPATLYRLYLCFFPQKPKFHGSSFLVVASPFSLPVCRVVLHIP